MNGIGGPVSLSVSNSTVALNSGVGIYVNTDIADYGHLPGTGSVSIHNSTVTANGGGIEEATTYSSVSFDVASSIVSGNNGSSFGPDFYSIPTLNASHCAIGSISGITTYHNLGGNLPTGASLGLRPLGFNGGATPTIALGAGSPAINAGSNPDNVLYDQRGTGYSRAAQGGSADIGAFERQPGVPSAAAAATNTAATSPTYQFTVTYADDAAVRYSSVAGNNNAVTISPPAGVTPVAVTFVSATPAADANSITATYQFTFPAGLATGADNGSWTVSTAANQVQNTGGVFVPAQRLARFQVQVARTLTVTNTNGSGPGSLVDAITLANTDAPSGDTIRFSNSSAGGAIDFSAGPHTITLPSILPPLVDPAAITGPGAALLTIDANRTGTLLVTNAGNGNTVTINGVILTGGAGYWAAGAVDVVSGNLTLNNVVVSGNSAGTRAGIGANGAGIYAGYGAGVVTIMNSTISNNTATYKGGGICVEGSAALAIINSTLADNQAGAAGGAVFFDSPGNLTITGSTLSGNSTGIYGGGAVYAEITSAATVAIADSTIVNNTANSSHGGGGIELRGVSSSTTLAVNVTSSTITGNTSASTSNQAGDGGGGIAAQYGAGTINLDNTIVSSNSSADGRSDISSVSGVHVNTTYSAIGNTNGFTYTGGVGDLPVGVSLNLQPLADNGGPTRTMALGFGSPAIDAGDPGLNGTTDQRGVNRPQGSRVDIGASERIPHPDATAIAANVIVAAGTVYTFTVTYADSVPIDSATLGSGNVTVATPAGVPPVTVGYIGANSTNPNAVIATYQFAAPGGAWSRLDNGAYTIIMQPNQVSDANGPALPGPIGAFQVLIPRTLTVTNPSDNGAGSGDAGDLRYCITQANHDGRAADTIVFSNSPLSGATNFYDGAVRSISLASSLPAISIPATIIGAGSAVLTINANGTGSVLRANPGAGNTLTITGLTFTGGTTGENGGGIDIGDGNLVLSNMVIANNSAANGAGICNESTGTITLTGTTVTGNTTLGYGGGIDLPTNLTGLLTITGSTISNNSAGERGGGVYLGPSNELLLVQSTVAGNSAWVGGGLSLYEGAMLIDRCTLTGNFSNGYGGGLAFAGPPLTSPPNASEPLTGETIRESTICGNTSTSGGGVEFGSYLSAPAGTLNIIDSTITGNSAISSFTSLSEYGGGGISLFAGTGTIALDGTIVSGNHSTNGRADIALAPQGSVTSTISAIGNTTGFTYTPGPGDLPVGANLHLQPLANNGGPTQTVAFSAGSPLLNAGDPTLSSTTDQRGVPRVIGPASDIGAYEYQPITVANVQINDGSAQRSEVRSIAVTFSGPVSFAGGNAAAAFQLQHVQDATNINNLAAAVSTNGSGQTVVTLTFSTTGNAATEIDPVSARNGGAASLADGRYSLTVLGSAVTDATLGWNLDGDADGSPGGNYVSPADTVGGGPGQLHLYRIFADTNGDGIVDQSDLGQFRSTLNAGSGNPLYLSILDADNSGVVDQIDLGQFRGRFNASVF